jgi:hypothetical protein
MRSAALVKVLEHEKMMAKGARMCMIVSDRVVIGLQALVLNDKHFAQVSHTTLFFLSVCAANGQSPV